MSQNQTRFKCSTTLPLGTTTTTIIDTYVSFAGLTLPVAGIKRILFAVGHDQSGILRVYESPDGVTYTQVYGDIAVAASSAGDVSGPYDWLVEPYNYFKVTWVNGGTNQGTWLPSLVLEPDRAAAV